MLTRKTWEEAEKMCQEKGANLIAVNDQEEMNFLKERMGKNGGWNGLSNQADIEKMEWSSGQSSEYRYWYTNEPNFGKKKKRRCVRMVKTKHYKWRMASCSAEYRFICEKGEYLASAGLRVKRREGCGKTLPFEAAHTYIEDIKE